MIMIVILHRRPTCSAQDKIKLRKQIRQLAAIYLASGINPEKLPYLYNLKYQHTCKQVGCSQISSVGELERMTQYKDKAQNVLTVFQQDY